MDEADARRRRVRRIAVLGALLAAILATLPLLLLGSGAPEVESLEGPRDPERPAIPRPQPAPPVPVEEEEILDPGRSGPAMTGGRGSLTPPPSEVPPKPVVPETAERADPAIRRSFRVRFRDPGTGEFLKNAGDGFARGMSGTVGGELTQWERDTLRLDSEGWLRLHVREGPEVAASRTCVEVFLPGFEKVRLASEECLDGTEVDLRPWTPRVRGVLVASGDEAEAIPGILYSDLPYDTRPSTRVRGIPTGPGLFMIFDLPDGRYELVVPARIDGKHLYARRSFELAGGPVDLGDIPLQPAQVLRARIVDGRGRPAAGERPLAGLVPPGTPILSGPGTLAYSVVEGRRIEGPEGWVVFEFLPPAGVCRVIGAGLPGVETTVTLPESGEFPASVELPWTGRRVDCFLDFTTEGREPDRWEQFHSPTIPAEHWTGVGVIRASLASGAHEVLIRARPRAGDPVRNYRGTVVIPERESFRATFDLAEAR